MIVYVTTPIYYPNDVPHLGTAYPTVAADIVARWARLCGQETFFLTGTDEHGKKIEQVAHRSGKAPQDFVDDRAAAFKNAFEKLGIRYSRFIRTTDADHIRVVQAVLQRVYEGGDIYRGTYEGLYCVDCEAYYKEEDLDGGRCPLHRQPVELLQEPCYYFCLSKYRNWLLELYEANPDFIQPPSRRNEVVSFVRGTELEDLCISRSTFKWGIPIPFDDEGHITYVWFDALLNYLTGIGYPDDEAFQKFWPEATHIIGKDILRFHAVIWPAILKSAGVQPPKRIFAHGFWTVNGQKFSKSLGNAIQPDYLIDRYGLDPLRYYMFREFPFGEDGDFSETNLVQRNNTELAHGLGNLLQRTLSLIQKYRRGVVPDVRAGGDLEWGVSETAQKTVAEASRMLEDLAFTQALETIWGLVRHLNAYINEAEPWNLEKNGQDDRLDTVLATLAEGLRFLSVLISPFMPGSGQTIAARLGLRQVPDAKTLVWANTLAGNRVETGTPLFKVLEVSEERVPEPVGHSAAREVLDLGISCCIAQINGVRVRRQAAGIERRKRALEERIRTLGPDWIKDVPEIQGYQEIYRKIGKAAGEIPSAIELLNAYIFESGRLPQINAVVDLYNLFALQTFLSIGAHDRDKIRGPIRLEIARERRSYLPLGGTTEVDILPGEYYWRDDVHVLCRLDLKQGEATKIDEKTRHIVLIVQGNTKISEKQVHRTTEEICREIVNFCGGDYRILGGNRQ